MIVINVPPPLADRCQARAKAAVKNCHARKNRELYSKGKISKAKTIQIHTVGFMAEAALCIYLGFDPDSYVNWNTDKLDDGFDLKVHGKTIDIKASDHPWARRLLWPVTKIGKLATAADVFVMAIVAPGMAECPGSNVKLIGWITREEFIARHFKAYRITGIVDGTPYMNEKDLYSMDQLLQHLNHSTTT